MIQFKHFGSVALIGGIMGSTTLALAEAECFVEDEVGAPTRDCRTAQNQLLAQMSAPSYSLHAHTFAGITHFGMFGFDGDGNWIETCEITERGPGTWDTDFGDCPGIESYTFYGNNDED